MVNSLIPKNVKCQYVKFTQVSVWKIFKSQYRKVFGIGSTKIPLRDQYRNSHELTEVKVFPSQRIKSGQRESLLKIHKFREN